MVKLFILQKIRLIDLETEFHATEISRESIFKGWKEILQKRCLNYDSRNKEEC
jgi:hypothetical protein